jgi:hypothetical protein
MDAVRTSKTSLYSNESTRRYISEDSNPHTRRPENLKSHISEIYIIDLNEICILRHVAYQFCAMRCSC